MNHPVFLFPKSKTTLRDWYAQSLMKKIQDAMVAAEAGNITSMETFLILARAYCDRSGQVLDAQEIQSLEQNGYMNGIKKKLREATVAAKIGDANSMEKAFELIHIYAQKAGISLNENDYDAVKKEGYTKGIERSLENAWNHALVGNVPLMEVLLDVVKKYRDKGGLPLDEVRVQAIIKEGCARGVEAKLKEAEIYAQAGDAEGMDAAFSTAFALAEKNSLPFDEAKARNIRKMKFNPKEVNLSC